MIVFLAIWGWVMALIFFFAGRQLMCWLGELEDVVERMPRVRVNGGVLEYVDDDGDFRVRAWERRTPRGSRGL